MKRRPGSAIVREYARSLNGTTPRNYYERVPDVRHGWYTILFSASLICVTRRLTNMKSLPIFQSFVPSHHYWVNTTSHPRHRSFFSLVSYRTLYPILLERNIRIENRRTYRKFAKNLHKIDRLKKACRVLPFCLTCKMYITSVSLQEYEEYRFVRHTRCYIATTSKLWRRRDTLNPYVHRAESHKIVVAFIGSNSSRIYCWQISHGTASLFKTKHFFDTRLFTNVNTFLLWWHWLMDSKPSLERRSRKLII